ncbi:MAG TPA: hypothetical protein VF945_12485 [Polyangia bacterium]
MRLSAVAAVSLALAALPACSSTTSMPDVRTATAALRQCFVSIAPLEVPGKAKVLAPCAEKDGPALIAALEKGEPTPPQVDCHADALAGARRAVGAMQDLLKIYRRNTDTGTRAVAAARNVDQGLTLLESAVADCTK